MVTDYSALLTRNSAQREMQGAPADGGFELTTERDVAVGQQTADLNSPRSGMSQCCQRTAGSNSPQSGMSQYCRVDGRAELTTERDVAVLPADGRVGGVAPGPGLFAAGVAAVVLGAGQLREQRHGQPVLLGVLAVPALTQDALRGGVHPALVEPAAAPDTVVCTGHRPQVTHLVQYVS